MISQDDLELLRTPISEQFPAGEGLRYEGTYDRIQEARREDDATLDQGIWQTALKRANWELAARLALEALETRTKDLQIAVWLLEARTELHGFAGAGSGLRIMHAICEAFWKDLFPKIEDDDLEYRLSPIEWINSRLTQRLKSIPITRPTGDESLPYSWAHLESAQRLENMARKDPKLTREVELEDQVTTVKFEASMMLTPDPYLRELFAELEESLAALDSFWELLREFCGDQTPSLAKFREALQSVRNLVAGTLHARGIAPRSEGNGEIQANGRSSSSAPQPSIPATNGSEAFEIRSRSDAYAMLAAISEYLMRIEPHSPTPYLVKRAVAWGSMPLPALLLELMEERSDLAKIYGLLGIREG